MILTRGSKDKTMSGKWKGIRGQNQYKKKIMQGKPHERRGKPLLQTRGNLRTKPHQDM